MSCGGRAGVHQVARPQGGDPAVLTAPAPNLRTRGSKGQPCPAHLTNDYSSSSEKREEGAAPLAAHPQGSRLLVPAQGPACRGATPQLPPSPGTQSSRRVRGPGDPGQLCCGRE